MENVEKQGTEMTLLRKRSLMPAGAAIVLGIVLGAATGHIAIGLVTGIVVGGFAGLVFRKR